MGEDKRFFKITARYEGRCIECRAEILEGDKIVWDRSERRVYCLECGEELLEQEE